MMKGWFPMYDTIQGTPRASNEARQTLFLKMSGAVQREIGLKAHELGGNFVVSEKHKL